VLSLEAGGDGLADGPGGPGHHRAAAAPADQVTRPGERLDDLPGRGDWCGQPGPDAQRDALTRRHIDLKNEFYQSIKERGMGNEDEARLRRAIAAKNKEFAQLRTDVRAVHQLTLETSSSAT
jgi:hypothetical protein